MKTTRSFSIVLGILFLLPFCAIGVIATVLSVLALSAQDWEKGGFLLIFGLAFGGAGFGLLAALFFGRRRALEEHELRRRHPEEPWKWREDWAEGRVRPAGLPAVWTAWVFALIWNSISSSVAFMLPGELEKGNHLALIGLVFPLVGIWLLVRAGRFTLQRRRFGDAVVQLETLPGVVGGQLAGTLLIPAGLPSDAQMHLRLLCMRRWRTSGSDSSPGESIEWQDEAPPARVLSAGGAAGVPFSFTIPAGLRPTDPESGGTGIFWRLSASARLPGVDFESDFEVPVFPAPGGPAAGGAEAAQRAGSAPDGVPGVSRDVAGVALPDGVSVAPGPGGGTEFTFHRWRNGRAALGIAAFAALWTGFTALLIHLGAPLVFPLVFGAFDILLLWFLLHMWAGETRVTVDDSGVLIHPRFPLSGSSTALPPGRITDVRLRIGMQSGASVYYNLELVQARGRGVTLPAFLRNRRDAERVAVMMKQTIAPTHNERTHA